MKIFDFVIRGEKYNLIFHHLSHYEMNIIYQLHEVFSIVDDNYIHMTLVTRGCHQILDILLNYFLLQCRLVSQTY